MVMDYLRYPGGCYRRRVRIHPDDATLYTIRWFFAPQGAKLFPGWHSFASEVWRADHTLPWDGIGEAEPARTWDNGKNYGYLGQCFRGQLEWFDTGMPVAALEQPAPVSTCCRAAVSDIPGQLGTRGGFKATLGRGEAGGMGLLGGWHGGTGPGTAGAWGLLDGMAARAGRGSSGAWGTRGGLAAAVGRGGSGGWGLLGGLAAAVGRGTAAAWGGKVGFTAVCDRGFVGSWGLKDGMGDIVPLLFSQVKCSTPQTVGNGSSVSISWTSAVHDPSGMWSAGAPTRLTAPRDGVYLFTCSFLYNSLPDGAFINAAALVNGAFAQLLDTRTAGSANSHGLAGAWTVKLTAGDYVELLTFQSSGGSRTILTSAGAEPWAQLTWLGIE